MQYDINEKHIFDNAKQPFSPTNIYNEIMENCGDFGPEQGVMTSVLVVDTDTFNIEYERHLNNLRLHLESIADQIVSFEPQLKTMKSTLPKLDLVSFTGFNQDYWQKPLLAQIRKELEDLAKLLKGMLAPILTNYRRLQDKPVEERIRTSRGPMGKLPVP